MSIEIKRVYEPALESDGRRVLVDRLWPRGISRQKAQLYQWLKDAAPSPELRVWFSHKAENFEQFSQLYQAELDNDPVKQSAVRHLLDMGKDGRVTLVYGAKNGTVSHAAVLRDYLLKKATDM